MSQKRLAITLLPTLIPKNYDAFIDVIVGEGIGIVETADLLDFAAMAAEWLNCIDPRGGPGCTSPSWVRGRGRPCPWRRIFARRSGRRASPTGSSSPGAATRWRRT